MAGRKRKESKSRSRSVSRGRPTSRSRTKSKTRSSSKSPARKSPPIVPRTPKQSPTTKVTESPQEVPSPPATRLRSRSSVRVIETIDVSSHSSKSTSPPRRFEETTPCKPHKRGSIIGQVPRSVLRCIFSRAMFDLVGAIFVPFFVYWAVSLVISPSKETFAYARSSSGYTLSVLGAKLNFNSAAVNVYIVAAVLVLHRLVPLLFWMVPFTKKVPVVSSGQRWHHRCSGLVVAILLVATLFLYATFGPSLLGVAKITTMGSFLPSISLGLAIDSVVCAVLCYISSRHIRPFSAGAYTLSGNFVVEFIEGRVVRPRVRGVDIKVFALFTGVMGALLLRLAYLIAQYNEEGKISSDLMVLSVLHVAYAIDFFYYESASLQDHGVLYYGAGLNWFLYVQFVCPILGSLGVFFCAQNYHAPYSWSEIFPGRLDLAAGCLVFLFGLIMRRAVVNQKNFFRIYPQIALAQGASTLKLETGKEILVEGLWGKIRHPDILGDVVMSIGLTLPIAVIGGLVPWIYPASVLVCTLIRVQWEECLCREKYGDALWNKYTKAVPYRLVPRVY